MSIFNNLKNSILEKDREINESCDSYINAISDALSEALSLTQNLDDFTDLNLAPAWSHRYSDLLDLCEKGFPLSLRIAKGYKELKQKAELLLEKDETLAADLKHHNDMVANNLISNGYSLVGDVEGRQLDEQQMFCIVKEAHNHLVIAGAGTGKTTTVVGRIKYLLKSGKCRPEDILVLSFTNASASEMSERIAKETGYPIAASTFHKLGLNIIRDSNDIMPKITTISMKAFIKDTVLQLMKNPKYLRLMNSYLINNRIQEKSEFEFESEEDYREYLQLNPPKTLKGEIVKSYGEMDIANLLFASNINYIYEHPYKIDTRTYEFGQYNPDFYLPDYDIYIEYFGINRKGEVPAYFSVRDGKDPSQVYRESMEWKRQFHEENGTTMVECFAYEKFDKTLRLNLLNHLSELGIQVKPMSPEELWAKVSSEDGSILDGLFELFETLISLLKSNNYTLEELDNLAKGIPDYSKNHKLIKLLEPVFNEYCKQLSDHDEIDFNDMINNAAECIRDGKYINPYKYVIVDEYQDISKARFNLLYELRQSSDYQLFCVGDDWQSIYRFAGSDIGYILNFEKFWGPTQSSKIETTYRFTKSLIEISGNFIMQNPAQIKKAIQGKSEDERFALGEIQGYTDKNTIDFMVERLNDLPQNSTVFFIGRYSFDAKLLDLNSNLSYKYDNKTGDVNVSLRTRRDLKMQFLTAHRSKGLQADYVFILNNKASRMGFPSKIQDSPLIGLLLDNSENYPYAEERRLFYVALTRAKVKAYLLTLKDRESIFAKELKDSYGEEMKRERFTCPICGGRLVKRSGKYGEFWGCSNYKEKGCKYIKNIAKPN